jgi:hypothetical protein
MNNDKILAFYETRKGIGISCPLRDKNKKYFISPVTRKVHEIRHLDVYEISIRNNARQRDRRTC